MKNYIGMLIVFTGLAMMFPAPIQLLRHGFGYPNQRLFAEFWIGGLPIILIGLAISWINTPPQRK